MTYPKVIARKIRMCARFGHLPAMETGRRWVRVAPRGYHYCARCGELVTTAKRGAA